MLLYVDRFFEANWQARRDMICYSSQLVCLIECFGDYLLYYLPLIEYIRLLVNPTLPFFLSSRRCKLHMALEDLFVSCRKLDASARKKVLVARGNEPQTSRFLRCSTSKLQKSLITHSHQRLNMFSGDFVNHG